MTAAAGRAAAGVFASLLAAATLAGQQTRPSSSVTGEWHLIVLGIAQDGGIPHPGCEQEICRVHSGTRRKPESVSLGLLNRRWQGVHVRRHAGFSSRNSRRSRAAIRPTESSSRTATSAITPG